MHCFVCVSFPYHTPPRALSRVAKPFLLLSFNSKILPRPPSPRRSALCRQGVEDSLANQTRLVDAARSRRRAAEETRGSVAEERKRFLAGSKELTDECYRYEALNAHLALMRR